MVRCGELNPSRAQKPPTDGPELLQDATRIWDLDVAGVKWLRLWDTQMDKTSARKGYRRVHCKCFKHWRTGKLVYPKHAECFTFFVRCK